MGTGRVLRSWAMSETGTLGEEEDSLDPDWRKRDEVVCRERRVEVAEAEVVRGREHGVRSDKSDAEAFIAMSRCQVV